MWFSKSPKGFTELKEQARGFFEPSNLDRRFTYTVPRTVTVQDARMGLSYYGMFIIIFLVIVLGQMGYSGGHLEFETPFGQVSFQVKRPTSATTPLSGENSYWNMSDSDRTSAAAGFLPIDHLPYCLNKTASNRFCSDDPTNQSYYCPPMSCAKATFNNITNVTTYSTKGRCPNKVIPLKVQDCRYVDEELIAPVVDERSILMVSRVSWMFQNLSCEFAPADNESCVYLYTPQTSTQKYHTVEPEHFEIMFDHEVFTPTNGVHGKQADFADAPFEFADGRTFWPAWINPEGNGSLYRPDDKPWIPGYYNILGRHTIQVNTLLEAAGLESLDAETVGLFDSGSTYRYTGVVVMLRIVYNNYEPFGYSTTQFPEYKYTTQLGTTYAAVHTVTWNGERRTDGSRLFENRHGIKIVITQEGSLASFTTVNAMIFLGGAVAIFAVASIFVDNIVIRFFVSKRTKEILELASNSTFPVRADLDKYVKTCEEHMGGAYEAPTSFWEVEKEWRDQGEREGRLKPRPDFKQRGAIELQKMLDRERLQREQTGDDTKGETELQIGGALAFARTISQNGVATPELHRNMSSIARAHWKIAKDSVYAQVRANQKPGLGRVATALAGRRQNAGSVEPRPSAAVPPASETAPANLSPSESGVVVNPVKGDYVPLD